MKFVCATHALQKYICLFIFLLLPAFSLWAQKNYLLKLEPVGSGKLPANLDYRKTFNDSLQCRLELKSIIRQLQQAAYLAASIDSVTEQDFMVKAYVQCGSQYTWARLRSGNVDEEALSHSGYRSRLYQQSLFSVTQLNKLFESLLSYYENNGYPFAMLRLDSVEFSENTVSASLYVERQQRFSIDSIEVIGNINLRRNFLYNYLGIKAGSLYNESLVRQADKKINQLSFARVSNPLRIYFTGSRARILTYIDSRKASQVDGILGVAPQSSINNKLVITGEANLNLQNLLGSGKSFELHYRNFLQNSQDLKARFVYPYLFNTSLGLDYNFALLKFDSLYLQVENDIGLQYLFAGNNYLKFFYNVQSTSLLSVDSVSIRSSRQLPQFADLNTNLYGLALKLNKLDYTYNPRKGWMLEASLGAGVKRIRKNSNISAIRFSDQSSGASYTLYDSLKLQSVQYRLNLQAGYFIPVRGKSTIHLATQVGVIEAPNIFTNELYRIGGIKTLKGFDEQSIFASSFAIISTEYRYLLSQNSNFILFWNGAWYERKTRSSKLSDRPYGFGTGVNLETAAGVLSFFYALGKQFNNPVELRNAKIHFGIVNYF